MIEDFKQEMNKSLKEVCENTSSGRKWKKKFHNHLKVEIELVKKTQTEGKWEMKLRNLNPIVRDKSHQENMRKEREKLRH